MKIDSIRKQQGYFYSFTLYGCSHFHLFEKVKVVIALQISLEIELAENAQKYECSVAEEGTNRQY
jgi:hypothetical protein